MNILIPGWLTTGAKIGPWIIVAAIFFYMITHPQKVERWGALLYRLFMIIHHSFTFEKRYISHDLQAKINLFVHKINSEVEILMPLGVKIKWAQSGDPEALVRGDKVFIKMKHYTSQDQNVATIINEYVPRTLIPKSRRYVYGNLLKAMDFRIAQKIFDFCKLYSCFDYFSRKVIAPEIARDKYIERYLACMEELDIRGYFTRILLPELSKLGEKLPSPIYTSERTGRIKAETRDFVQFLRTVISKEPTEDVALTFKRVFLSAAIILIAKKSKLYDVSPYLHMFRIRIDEGYERIYILAWGPHIKFGGKVISEIGKQFRKEAVKIYEKSPKIVGYKKEPVRGIFVVFENKTASFIK